jgi:AcrR family transcriptional regulator
MASETHPVAPRRPQLSREFVEAHRRRRYVDATAEILHEFGRPGLTTTNVVRVAGGSRGSFYQTFSGIEECVAVGIAIADGELFGVLEDLPGDGDWAVELLAAITGFFEAVATEPLLAELFLIHAACSRSDVGRAAFLTGGERFVDILRRGRVLADARGVRRPPALVEECLSRGIVGLATESLRGPDLEDLPAKSRSVATLAALFYLGPEGAGEAIAGALPRAVH